MRVSELMSKNVEHVAPDQSIRLATRKMRDLNVGSLPVLLGDELVGIVTDRDLACFSVALGHDPINTSISMVMSKKVVTCYEDDDIADAARIMEKKRIRRLAVIDHENRLTGLFSIDDLARGSHKLAGIVLAAAEAIH